MAGMMAAMGMGGGGGGFPPGVTPPGGGMGKMGGMPNLDQLRALGGGKLPGLGGAGGMPGAPPNLGALSDLLKKK